MITNKSSSIRVGYSRNWPVSFSTKSSAFYVGQASLQKFFDSFFFDSSFRDRGFISSHSVTRYSLRETQLYSFIQDAKLVDFFNTFPRRSIFMCKRRRRRRIHASRFGKKFRFNRFDLTPRKSKHKFFFSRRRLFFTSRSYRFTRAAARLLISHLVSKSRIKFSRLKRHKRYLSLNQVFFINFFNFVGARNFFRARYYFFITKLLSYFFYSAFNSPLHIHFNHIITRQATSTFYLNYICTRLYYRYILNDVVNPLVRISLRYYRGFAINCKGRFTRAQIASQKKYRRGSIAFSRITNNLDYAQKSVVLKYGACNLKLWIRR